MLKEKADPNPHYDRTMISALLPSKPTKFLQITNPSPTPLSISFTFINVFYLFIKLHKHIKRDID